MGLFDRLLNLSRAEYLLRPHQIPRKFWREMVDRRRVGVRAARLPWGVDIDVDISESIGWSVYNRGIFETEVTEALWRLARPGDTVVDGGANIGYMTSLLAARVGPAGVVHSFEPHPEIFRELESNAQKWRRSGKCGNLVLHPLALGESRHSAKLTIPADFNYNRGTSRIDAAQQLAEDGTSVTIQVVPLDDVFPADANLAVVKLDLQGYEIFALKGMRRLLDGRRIIHLVFEEEAPFPAPTHDYLRERGYTILGLERSALGLRCVVEGPPRFDPIGSPNYVATSNPENTRARLERGIWRSFGPLSRLGA
jgi:FkbM family methyltransferase